MALSAISYLEFTGLPVREAAHFVLHQPAGRELYPFGAPGDFAELPADAEPVQLVARPLLGAHSTKVSHFHAIGVQEQRASHTARIGVLVCCVLREHVPSGHQQQAGNAHYGARTAARHYFADMSGHWAEAWADQARDEGITSGCGGGNFCPSSAVLRDQAAVLIENTFHIIPPPGPFSYTDKGTWRKYYFAGSQRVAMHTCAGTSCTSPTFFLGDHLGSTSLGVDIQGARTSEIRYKAWGELRYAWTATTSPLPIDYTYTGQRSYMDDPTTTGAEGFGLMYYNARWYDPYLNRFAQADSIIPGAGNPQAWDR